MNIYNMTLEDLENYFLSISEKKFKAKQLYKWLYEKKIHSFDEITDIKKEVISRLKLDFVFERPELIKEVNGDDVHKYLFKLKDDSKIEAVVMSHGYGLSLCISSQVGCNMGCVFCESGKLLKKRNLETYEMVLQILEIEEKLDARISSIVVMGIGEPFDNYDNVVKFLDITTCPFGINKGVRHITVSTCGIVPKIKEFANLKNGVNLAISLHAPNDKIRNQIMKINKIYNIETLLEAVDYYINTTNRRVAIEYVMLKDLNDNIACANELASILKGKNIYVNLIPYNQTSSNLKASDKKNIMKFYDILKSRGIDVTVRREFGDSIDAACGQLSSKYQEEK